MKRVLYASPRVFAVAFIVGGIVMIIVERIRPVPTVLDAERASWPRALGIGVCQTLALIPGVSRSGATIVGGMMAGLDRPAAAEFSFFLAMPTMAAAFAHDLLGMRHELTAALGLEIAVGLVMAFISSLLVIRPFLVFRQAVGIRAVRMVSHRGWRRDSRGSGRRVDAGVMSWLRRRFVTGFFVMVPLIISILALIWIFRVIDGFTAPVYARLLGPGHVPPGLGILTTGAHYSAVGVVSTNVLGKRLLQGDGELSAAGAGVSHHLRARQTAGARVFAGQRIRVQAGGAWRARPPAVWYWDF